MGSLSRDYVTEIVKIQWNASKVDTIGTEGFFLYSEVSIAQGLVAGHTLVLMDHIHYYYSII